MITLSAFILTIVGCINWFCIAIFQYDFVAGLFGSQASIFSRLIYGIIGIAALLMVYASFKSKGKIVLNGKKQTDKEMLGIKLKSKNKIKEEKLATNTESAKDNDMHNYSHENKKNCSCDNMHHPKNDRHK